MSRGNGRHTGCSTTGLCKQQLHSCHIHGSSAIPLYYCQTALAISIYQRSTHLARQHEESCSQSSIRQHLRHLQCPWQSCLTPAGAACCCACSCKAQHCEVADALCCSQQAIRAGRQAAACRKDAAEVAYTRSAQQEARTWYPCSSWQGAAQCKSWWPVLLTHVLAGKMQQR